MAETTISVRIDKYVHEQMKQHDEINWSAVLRKSVAQTLENAHAIDFERAQAASEKIGEMRKLGVFSGGEDSTAIIRKWRSQRR